jgi:uncharacterized phage protein gp47/JayE
MSITFNPDTGMSAQDTATIRQGIVDDWNAVFSDENATLNTESESPAGQIIDSMAVLCTAKDSEFLELGNNFNPKTSAGIWQDAIGAIYFLQRKTAEPTVVTCQLTGLNGTVIPARSIIQNDDGIKLQSVGDVTIADGTAEVEFQAIDTGAIPIGAGSCNKIVTVIAGWDTVSNEVAGTLGREVESRVAFEKRRAMSVAYNSHGSRLALQAALSALNGVLDCRVLENKLGTSVTKQGVNLISHSVAICIYGGEDDDIAEAIYNKLDAGCGTNGETTVTFTSEDTAVNRYQIIRPDPTNLYISVTIHATPDTPESIISDIQNAVYNDFYGNDLNSGNVRRGCGDTIYASSFSVALIKTAGVTDLESICIGRTSDPQDNLVVMDADEEPVIDKENIAVTVLVD